MRQRGANSYREFRFELGGVAIRGSANGRSVAPSMEGAVGEERVRWIAGTGGSHSLGASENGRRFMDRAPLHPFPTPPSAPGRGGLSTRVVHAVDWLGLGQIVQFLERIGRTVVRIDERRQMLGFFVGRAARIHVRHHVTDDPGQRIDARRAGAVVPRVRPPQRPGFLRADLDSLPVLAVTVGAALQENGLAELGVEFIQRQSVFGRDRVLTPPRCVLSRLESS